jgi:hypothetical protein
VLVASIPGAVLARKWSNHMADRGGEHVKPFKNSKLIFESTIYGGKTVININFL